VQGKTDGGLLVIELLVPRSEAPPELCFVAQVAARSARAHQLVAVGQWLAAGSDAVA
jgi:hypothetical protein